MVVEAYIGLGSNLGNRKKNITEAVRLLSEMDVDVKLSSIYESRPVGFVSQPTFFNAVCRINTRLNVFDLLDVLKKIECLFGRRRSFPNAPRVLDLDILMYGDHVYDLPSVKIPHHRMTQRAFVLVPLAEIASNLPHPILNVSIGSLLNNLIERDIQMVRKLV